jgi:hypothetical protein
MSSTTSTGRLVGVIVTDAEHTKRPITGQRDRVARRQASTVLR